MLNIFLSIDVVFVRIYQAAYVFFATLVTTGSVEVEIMAM
jgi:hypothetical protein